MVGIGINLGIGVGAGGSGAPVQTLTLYPTLTGAEPDPPTNPTQDMRITFTLENATEFGATFVASTVGGGANQTLPATCSNDGFTWTAIYIVMGFGNFPHINEIVSATLYLTATAVSTDGPMQMSFMVEPFPLVDPQANDDWFTEPSAYVWSDDAECLAATDWFPGPYPYTAAIDMTRAFNGEVDPGLLDLEEYHEKAWPARINLVIGTDGFIDLGVTIATADHATAAYRPRLVLVYR